MPPALAVADPGVTVKVGAVVPFEMASAGVIWSLVLSTGVSAASELASNAMLVLLATQLKINEVPVAKVAEAVDVDVDVCKAPL